ncbi:unnamed protein product [Lathyrus oleraceus]
MGKGLKYENEVMRYQIYGGGTRLRLKSSRHIQDKNRFCIKMLLLSPLISDREMPMVLDTKTTWPCQNLQTLRGPTLRDVLFVILFNFNVH